MNPPAPHGSDDVKSGRGVGVAGSAGGDRRSSASPPGKAFDRAFVLAERVVYAGVATLLVLGGVALLADTVIHFPQDAADGVKHGVQEMLDRLLLVFILIELLAAVRATLSERQLVAEPFLLVGIIATIKEVVVLGISAREVVGKDGTEFRDSLQAIGVLTVLLMVLALSSFLIRRKEREPAEASD